MRIFYHVTYRYRFGQQSHTVYFWDFTIQGTSHDDLTETSACWENFYHIQFKKIVNWANLEVYFVISQEKSWTRSQIIMNYNWIIKYWKNTELLMIIWLQMHNFSREITKYTSRFAQLTKFLIWYELLNYELLKEHSVTVFDGHPFICEIPHW
jgi:hypothetical protein